MFKKLFVILISFFMIAGSVQAVTNPNPYTSYASSEQASQDENPMWYQPFVKNTFESKGIENKGWSEAVQLGTIENGKFSTGAAVLADDLGGNRWVNISPTTLVRIRYEKGILKIVVDLCKNGYKGIWLPRKKPTQQILQHSAPVTPIVTQESAGERMCKISSTTTQQCAQAKVCDAENGWVTGSDGVPVCKVNGKTSRIIETDTLEYQRQLVVKPSTLATDVRPWGGVAQDFSVSAPPAPIGTFAPTTAPTVNLPKQNLGTVNTTQCRFDCVTRETVRDVSGFQNQPSPNGQCEIRWKADTQEGRLLLDNYNGKLRLASVMPGQSSPAKVMTTPISAGRDCNVDQAEVKKNWDTVVRMMGLPTTCKPN